MSRKSRGSRSVHALSRNNARGHAELNGDLGSRLQVFASVLSDVTVVRLISRSERCSRSRAVGRSEYISRKSGYISRIVSLVCKKQSAVFRLSRLYMVESHTVADHEYYVELFAVVIHGHFFCV